MSDLLAPTRARTVWLRGNLAALAVVVAFGLLAAGADPRSTVSLLAAWMAALVAGWMLTATAFVHVTTAEGLACEPPGLHANFHALSRFRLRVRLDNLSRRWPALCLLVDFTILTDGRALVAPPRFLDRLPPRETAEFAWTLTARRRGVYELAGVRVRSFFPGSLVERESTWALGAPLVALPAVYELKPRAHELLIGRRRAAGRLHRNPVAMEEFVGTRDYRPGDNPRHIHMALSLRMPDYPVQLVMREFDDPSDEDVSIILDTAFPEGDDLMGYRYEKALSFSLALCRMLAERKYRVRFMAAGGLDLQVVRPRHDMPRLEARLALLTPAVDRGPVWRLLEDQSRRSNSAVLFVSLREVPEERLHPRLQVLTLTPDWQAELVERVVGV